MARRARQGSGKGSSDDSPFSRQYLRELTLRREDVPGFERYPFSIPAIRHLDRLPLHPGVTFLVGENGSGKSTLLEAIAVSIGLNAEGGSQNFRFATHDSHSELNEFLRVVRGMSRPADSFFLRAESFYNVASEVERLDREVPGHFSWFGGRSLHQQSHGESFLATLLNRFTGGGIYLLDEPEAALSPVRQMSFLVAIDQLVKDASQFIIATHSPIILAYPNATIYELGEHAPRETTYKETEHYRITHEFLNNPERMLHVLLSDPEP